MGEREKIIKIVYSTKYCKTGDICDECKYNKELDNYTDTEMWCRELRTADALIAANIGDVTEWKKRAERMHKEALKQKQLVADFKHREDILRNQLKCAMGMVSEMEHTKRTLEILYVSGVITEEALRDAVKQAKLEIEEENEDDR